MELDLLESCYEYLCDLRAEWYWKRNTTPQNNRRMADIDGVIERLERAILAAKKSKPC